MTSRSVRFLCSGVLVVLASAGPGAGGWAVITVKDLPDYAVVGRPLTLTYAVRQHGQHLLGGLDGRLELRAGGRLIQADASASPETGHYSATFTLPEPGKWTVDIKTGWADGTSGARLTLQAIEP